MSEVRQKLISATQLGNITFHVQLVGPFLTADHVSLRHVPLVPRLPAGMSTKALTAILLETQAGSIVQSVVIEAIFETESDGSACCGECLVAQEWTDGRSLVVIGTEDEAALSLRYPSAAISDRELVVDLLPHSMTLRLSPPEPLVAPSFHFIIAENPDPEPVELSAWFAVDQAHDDILQRK